MCVCRVVCKATWWNRDGTMTMNNIRNQVNVERIIISISNVKTKLLHAHFKLNIFHDLNTYMTKVITKNRVSYLDCQTSEWRFQWASHVERRGLYESAFLFLLWTFQWAAGPLKIMHLREIFIENSFSFLRKGVKFFPLMSHIRDHLCWDAFY